MSHARPAPGTNDNIDDETLPAPSQPVAVCIARRYRRSAAGPHHSLPSTLPYSSSLPSALAGSALDSSPALPSSAVPRAAAPPSPDASPEGTHHDTAAEAASKPGGHASRVRCRSRACTHLACKLASACIPNPCAFLAYSEMP